MEDEIIYDETNINDDNKDNTLIAKIKARIHRLSPHINLPKCEIAVKRICPHLSIALGTMLVVVAIACLATGIIKTATIGQEMELMLWDQSNTQSDQELETTEEQSPTKEAEFEISGSEPTVTTHTVVYPTSQMCFIGDGRTADMEEAVITDVRFITKSSAGFKWFVNNATAEFEKMKKDVGLCVVALGINDLVNVEKYIKELNEFADKYPDKIFIYVNLGPVNEEKHTDVQNSSLKSFNDKMQQGLSSRWQIVDQYTYLAAEGFSSDDGFRYSYHDSAKIFAWIVDLVKTQTITETI